MIEQVKVRVDTQLQATLERLQEVLMERPSWAEDVASADSIRAVSVAVQALPKSAPTAAEVTALRDAILALPRHAASPEAVAELKASVDALGTLVRGQAERPAWADEVARAVLDAVRAVPAPASPADVGAVRDAVHALPRQAASPEAVAALATAVAALTASVSALPGEAASPAMVQGLRDEVVALRNDVRGQGQVLAQIAGALTELRAHQEAVRASCQRFEAELGALRQVTGQNELLLGRLNRPWYLRLFSN